MTFQICCRPALATACELLPSRTMQAQFAMLDSLRTHHRTPSLRSQRIEAIRMPSARSTLPGCNMLPPASYDASGYDD
jgi:hypothetical protein